VNSLEVLRTLQEFGELVAYRRRPPPTVHFRLRGFSRGCFVDRLLQDHYSQRLRGSATHIQDSCAIHQGSKNEKVVQDNSAWSALPWALFVELFRIVGGLRFCRVFKFKSITIENAVLYLELARTPWGHHRDSLDEPHFVFSERKASLGLTCKSKRQS